MLFYQYTKREREKDTVRKPEYILFSPLSLPVRGQFLRVCVYAFFLPCPFLPRMIVTHSRSACNRNPGKEKTTAERRKIKEEKNCEQQQEDKRDRPLPLFVRHCFFLPNEKKEDREEGRVVVIKRPRHTLTLGCYLTHAPAFPLSALCACNSFLAAFCTDQKDMAGRYNTDTENRTQASSSL